MLKVKKEASDLMTYVNADISFRGAIPARSFTGEDRFRQNEVITLEEAAVTRNVSQAWENSLVLSSRSDLKGGTQWPRNHHRI